YPLYLQLFSNLAGEHWSCSPKRHEHHSTRIKTLLHRRRPQRLHNLRHSNSQNTYRSINHIHSKRLRNQLSNGPVGKLWFQPQISPEQKAWTQTPEYERCIRYRRQASTRPVARGTRRRSSTLRPNMENKGMINPSNTTSTNSTLDKIHHRKPNTVSSPH